MKINMKELSEEAQAFDSRIGERLSAGFIPDLRRAVKCDHFYKSFWRIVSLRYSNNIFQKSFSCSQVRQRLKSCHKLQKTLSPI